MFFAKHHSQKNQNRGKRGQQGAATVEFAIAMMFTFFMFIAFYQIIEIFLVHERLSYASFVASRAYQVHGNSYTAAQSVLNDFSLEEGPDSLTLKKNINVPLDFLNISWEARGASFKLSQKTPTFIEPRESGDN